MWAVQPNNAKAKAARAAAQAAHDAARERAVKREYAVAKRPPIVRPAPKWVAKSSPEGQSKSVADTEAKSVAEGQSKSVADEQSKSVAEGKSKSVAADGHSKSVAAETKQVPKPSMVAWKYQEIGDRQVEHFISELHGRDSPEMLEEKLRMGNRPPLPKGMPVKLTPVPAKKAKAPAWGESTRMRRGRML